MSKLTPKQEKFLNLYVQGQWKLNSRGLIDVDGSVEIEPYRSRQELGLDVTGYPKGDIKDLWGLKFGYVSGDFNASGNRFVDLSGFPLEVGGSLILALSLNARKRSLEDLPTRKVGEDMILNHNYLFFLKGGPEEVGGSYYCNNNKLQSLVGAPRRVGGTFECYDNQLKDLVGAPRYVGGNFICYWNRITTLVGGPEEVGGDFICHGNRLRNLEGLPKIGGKLDVRNNPLKESCSYIKRFDEFLND